jgi:NAD(P)-dependent dehydrogenase (short-subunit alcohol dehydrogenase family)
LVFSIGLATAERFVKEGAYVFIIGRRQAELDAAVSLIGKNVTAVQADVSKLDDLGHLYQVVRKTKGRVDVVFANAGKGTSAGFRRTDGRTPMLHYSRKLTYFRRTHG